MFGKPARADGPGALAAPSLIGAELTIEGGVSGPGDLHLDGRIIGDVKVSRLTVGESGSVQGSIDADTVDIRGRLTGSIRAKVVRLAASAHVEADVTHEQMSVDLGAHFQGRLMQTGAAATPALAAPADTTALA